MARSPFVVANWKMNHTRALGRAWCSTLADLHKREPWAAKVDTGVAPPFTSLEAVREGLAQGQLPLQLGAQNVHWEPKGAYTGEIAPAMLVEAGCRFVILGHSERRHIFGETDERIAKKVSAAQGAGLVPMLCVGEQEPERDAGRTEAVIEGQLRKGLSQFLPLGLGGLALAYEPVWAIGTGKTAQPEQAQEAQQFLRGILAAMFGATFADVVPILYGGSVTPANAPTLGALPDVDGFLVGGASLDAHSFHKLAVAAGVAKGL